MKSRFKLNNLTCPNCAKKIEDALNKREEVNSANVNFAKLEVTVDTSLNDGGYELVKRIVKKIEPNVKVTKDEEKNNNIKFDVIRLICGLLLYVLAIIIKVNIIHNILIVLAYITLLFRVAKKAILMLLNGLNIDENLLVTISCVGAYFTDNIHEGLMVIILYEIGKILESIAVNNSRKSISDLMNIKPLYANLKKGDKIIKIKPEEVKINDLLVVKKGEKVPVDGIVIEGNTLIDNRALTGESELVEVYKDDNILSGSINSKNVITIKVTKDYENSTVNQILNLVENATDKKAKTENFVSKAAKIYTPTVLLLAILIIAILPLITTISVSEAIYRALVFLVISCPCAIAISVPLSYFTGIGAASKEGILIKGSNFLEASSNIKEIIFDKTGTITNGDFFGYKIDYLSSVYSMHEVKSYYVSGEVYSNHPIAKSILGLLKDEKKYKISDFEEIDGMGIRYKYKGKTIKVGSASFCNRSGDDAIYLTIDNELIAKLFIEDGIKENAKETIEELKEQNINVKMFTGDNEKVAKGIAKKVGIEDVCYELLPQDKFKLLEEEINKYDGDVAFVGDGINDAPALRIAKIGISMGSIGSEAAIEASDIVIMNDNLDSIPTLMKISKKTNKIIKQNLIFAIGTKLFVLLLSGLGIASMWQAVFADTGVTLLTIINTTRILNKKQKGL